MKTKSKVTLFIALSVFFELASVQAVEPDHIDTNKMQPSLIVDKKVTERIYLGILRPNDIVGTTRKGWYTSEASKVQRKAPAAGTIYPLGYLKEGKFFYLSLQGRRSTDTFGRCVTLTSIEAKDECLLHATASALRRPELENAIWNCNGNKARAFSGTVDDYRDTFKNDEEAEELYEGNSLEKLVDPVFLVRDLNCGKSTDNPHGWGIVSTENGVKSRLFVRREDLELKRLACIDWLNYRSDKESGKSMQLISSKKNAMKEFAPVLKQICDAGRRTSGHPFVFNTYIAYDQEQKPSYAFAQIAFTNYAEGSDQGGSISISTWFKYAKQGKIEVMPGPITPHNSPNYWFSLHGHEYVLAQASREPLGLEEYIEVVEEVTDRGFKRIGYVLPSQRTSITAQRIKKLPLGWQK